MKDHLKDIIEDAKIYLKFAKMYEQLNVNDFLFDIKYPKNGFIEVIKIDKSNREYMYLTINFYDKKNKKIINTHELHIPTRYNTMWRINRGHPLFSLDQFQKANKKTIKVLFG